MARDPTAGPDSGPETPFPIKLSGQIVKGFGRGSSELGIPTANIPIEGLDVGGHTGVESGVYFGWAGISLAPLREEGGNIKSVPDPQKDAEQASHGSTNSFYGGQSQGLLSKAVAHIEKARAEVYPMVMSIGWNPYYKNEKRSVEVHLIHEFKDNFYGALMNLQILGFIRPEKDYDSLDALVTDIKEDIEVTKRSLAREAYASIKGDPWLRDWDWAVKSPTHI